MQITISNKLAFEKKLKNIAADGAKNLHIISDFDKTLTKTKYLGKELASSYDLIRKGNYLKPEYLQKSYAIKNKYYPYEISTTISHKYKMKMMKEWWDTHYNLMIKAGMEKWIIEDIVKKGKTKMRKNAFDLIDLTNKKGIPFLIFSAGMGNTIEELLRHNKKYYKNVHIIANFFKFNKKGIAVGHNKNLIHVFNKNEVEIKNTPYYKNVQRRKNVILLGDSLGDLKMADGLKHKTVLKIGFLNENNKDAKKEYEDNFDAVILNDGSMKFVLDLIKEIK